MIVSEVLHQGLEPSLEHAESVAKKFVQNFPYHLEKPKITFWPISMEKGCREIQKGYCYSAVQQRCFKVASMRDSGYKVDQTLSQYIVTPFFAYGYAHGYQILEVK